MLESIQDQYSEIQKILEDRGESHTMPEPEDLLNDLVTLVKPFKNTTDELNATCAPTLHLAAVFCKQLQTKCKEFHSDHPAMLTLAELLLKTFSSKCSLQSEHKVACFLHPPFRKLRFFEPNETAKILSLVCSKLLAISEPFNSAYRVLDLQQSDPLSCLTYRYMKTGWTVVTDTDEVTRYHQLECQSQIGDAAKFWKENETQFPGLFKMVKKYLVTAAGSVPSGRLFRKAGFLIDDERWSLKSDKANDIMFLYSNRDKF
ncbi:hypothetical protein BV898_13052 [Hypsibius exemplaris]|uniref:HAT C-terminal dimerisation domain-containing protein n=1 Tax=Hypsibius exemplaris TaxID=2072580 RepID=A0A1W0WC41_HYPEX|nr:hypothetical protein BV898_13052 [Hypsibius exemplaris]